MSFDWDDLRIFLAVARGESLSAAGRNLRLDAATVGRRIARLEEEMGAPLFARSPQGYALSAAGERLIAHAEAMEEAAAAGADALAGESGALSGQVRIGAPDGCANFLLPQVCARIVAEHPELELHIVSQPRVVSLSRREADLAIAVSRPDTGRVTVQKVTDYRLHLAASAAYLTAHGEPASRAALGAHPVVGYIPDMIFDKELDYLAEIGADKVTLASNSVSVQLAFLRQGGGLGIVHDFALPFAPELRKVLTNHISLTRAFWMIRHQADARSDRLGRVAELVARGLRAEVARLEALT